MATKFSILDTSRSDGKLTIDFDLVLENIAELNALAGDGVAKIQHTVDGARLKVRVGVLAQMQGCQINQRMTCILGCHWSS